MRTVLTTVLAGAVLATAGVGVRLTAEATPAAADTERVRFERWATLEKLPKSAQFPHGGYYYDAGQQNTRLTITEVPGGVRFADRRTDVLRSKPAACDRRPADVGIVVVCRVPRSTDAGQPMTVKVFTRRGHDFVDASRLSAAFELYMLADIHRDTIYGGAGDDFVNGAQNRDRVWGGPGNDWLTTGLGNDLVVGGPGRDKIIGAYDRDTIRGGPGRDSVYGGPGLDRMYPGPAADRVVCGPGTPDVAFAQRTDDVARDCETVNFG